MTVLRLATYQHEDQEGFARLVEDVHSEFGFSYDAELDADLDDPESHYPFILLVKCGTSVVGSAALTEPRDGSTTLKRMYLRPSLRSLGWGRRLLDGVTERAVEYGCEQIRLDTTTRQAGARRLYERNGFTLVSRDRDTLFYSKDIGPLNAVAPEG
ncbi:GNAT family N-acetyltransferase [Brachybacterium paraconglomeratum]|uniref:GNAT family N-acetyltransferase n=1 Tax=Brachybacterium paraconglomeratum TaxID=173362 RepID=UPI0022AE70D1|nr:GNAT family N-acetyltransferase [Brachybacterium paraconglomeratum]MCZ4327968.1 GNAT family N-acetyltransferase [Brachybacterium paraconglomeratum]